MARNDILYIAGEARNGILTDTISELTAANGVAIDGLRIKDGAIAPAAGGTAVLDCSAAATGESDIVMGDNLADAFTFREGSTAYLTLVTTNSGEKVQVKKTLDIDAASVDVSTQATAISVLDNSATALEIKEASTVYLGIDTTNSAEKVIINKTLDFNAASLDVSTQATAISIKDNEAAALDIAEGANSYLKCVSTNSSEKVQVGVSLQADIQVVTDTIAEKTATAGVTVDGCLIKDGRAAAMATAAMFVSTEQTGTAAPQNIAHGFGAAPSKWWVEWSDIPAGGCTQTAKSQDATNVTLTVTTGAKFYIHALK